MSASVRIGNDVVDLALPEARGKAQDERFVRRVCSAAERALLDQAPPAARDQVLWCLWSAKEAAFKVAKKRWPRTVFSPFRFEVTFAALPPPWAGGEGTVTTSGCRIPVRWTLTAECAHCVGSWPLPPQALPVRAEVERWKRPLPGPQASARVRGLALRLLAEGGVRKAHIQRDGGGPPTARREGGPRLDCELSLSHHGRFVAAAVWIPTQEKGRPRNADRP